MPKLHQVIALAGGRKSRTESAVTKIYHNLQQAPLFGGMEKSYRPKEENGDEYPGESKRLQSRAESLLAEAANKWEKLFDIVATQDHGNTAAKANVCVPTAAGKKVILSNVPVSTMLFLEKQLVDIRTTLQALPVLDPTKEWEYSDDADCYRAKPRTTVKTKKIPKFTVAYDATKEHPAQVDKDFEDVLEGYWTTVDFSGAVSASRKNTLLSRVDELIDAVKSAREEANSTEVEPVEVGKQIFSFLLADK